MVFLAYTQRHPRWFVRMPDFCTCKNSYESTRIAVIDTANQSQIWGGGSQLLTTFDPVMQPHLIASLEYTRSADFGPSWSPQMCVDWDYARSIAECTRPEPSIRAPGTGTSTKARYVTGS